MNAQALNETLDHFARVMPDFLVRESDFTFNVDLASGFLYDLRLYGVKLSKFEIGQRNIQIIPGDKHTSVLLEISNAHVKGQLDGGLQFGSFKLFDLTTMDVTGLHIKMELGVSLDE